MRTLRNPVIRGFAPDPSLIRVGDWYYAATSSFEWFPTIPLHRSRDLVCWEYAGHVAGAVPGDSLSGVPDSGGIWAPALSWDGERFWMVYAIVRSLMTPYFNLEVYVCTATDPAGPWSAPRRVSGHGFDPSLFHHEGRLWLLNLQNDHRPGGNRFDGIVLTELDRDTLTPIGPSQLILQRDPRRERFVEGPKLLFRNGWFYLVLAEGGTGFEHGVLVSRSRNIAGPYELCDEPLLTARDDPSQPLQKAGHGELVQAPDGDWFCGHLTSRPLTTVHGPRCTLGRETAIQAIVWDEREWPRLRQGGWHPAVEVDVPDVPDSTEPTSQDAATDVGDPKLGWPWSTLRGRPDASWVDTTSRPGWIRLRGRHGPESLWEQSLLAQRITEHRSHVEVTVDARPTTFTQAAGLVLWYNTEAYFSLDLTWTEPEGAGQSGQQWRDEGRTALVLTVRTPNGTRIEAIREIRPGGPATVGATTDGADAQFWIRDNDRREPVGGVLDFSELSDDAGRRLRFTGAFAGIRAHDVVDGVFTADFSGFRLTAEV